MLERFRDPETVRRLDVETMEMLAIRGGADKLLFADPRPELNGRTLAAVAAEWELSIPAAVRRILSAGNAAVMNLDLYDIENTRYLARQPWMMTCTDGRTPSPTQNVTHPRVFGAFTRKIRQFVLDERNHRSPRRERRRHLGRPASPVSRGKRRLDDRELRPRHRARLLEYVASPSRTTATPAARPVTPSTATRRLRSTPWRRRGAPRGA